MQSSPNNPISPSPTEAPNNPLDALNGNVDERSEKLVNLILTNATDEPVEALALLAGYSESYAKVIGYRVIRTESFQARLLDAYKHTNATLLPKCLTIRQLALDKLIDDPDKALKYTKLLESTERIAGVHNEEQVKAPTINIGQIQMVVQQIHQDNTTRAHADQLTDPTPGSVDEAAQIKNS